MHRTTRRPSLALSPLCFLAALGLVACDGSAATDAGPMGTDAGATEDGGSTGTDAGPMTSDAATPSGVPIDGWLFDTVSRATVADAQVCVLDHPEVACATTDADGAFLLMADVSGPVALDVTHDDYYPTLVHLEVGSEGGSFPGAAVLARAFAALFDASGAPPDPTKGHLASSAIYADGSPASGATVTIDPASGIGPVYFSSAGPDPSLTEVVGGPFNAINMDEGDVTVTIAHPSASCPRLEGASWPAADPTVTNATTVRIRAGYISIFGSTRCVATP